MLSLEFDDVLGTALAAGSSLIWAAYWILNIRDKRNNIDKLLFNFALGFVIILLLSLALQVPILLPQAIPLYAILSGVYVGIFEMGLTFVLWMNALQLSESTAKVSNLIFLTPFISLLFIRFTLNEPIHIATIAGLILIITSNIIQKT
jgi:drug/metabolite transporter (DMT)-like permease